jgi:hypothetical protein
MPLTKEELQKSEFYQRLKEQDRTQYLNELEQRRKLNGAVIITEDNNVIVNSEAPPLRNDAGVFIAIEDPFEEGKNLTDDDQIVKITKKTSVYQTSPQWDVILDREFKEL